MKYSSWQSGFIIIPCLVALGLQGVQLVFDSVYRPYFIKLSIPQMTLASGCTNFMIRDIVENFDIAADKVWLSFENNDLVSLKFEEETTSSFFEGDNLNDQILSKNVKLCKQGISSVRMKIHGIRPFHSPLILSKNLTIN